jgi:HD-GYP domain-containing protein (c-di-GMP phosphodiesterase class II)
MSFASPIGSMVYLLKAIEPPNGETSAYRKAGNLFEQLKQRDRFYEGHIYRACYYALDFGRHQGLTQKELQQLYLATLFHDIGKAMIPAYIINKQAPLNTEEHNVLRAHPALGEKICLDLGPFEEIAALVGSHHERPNATGYPRGLKADEISFLARILAVIEIYDALRSTRSYKVPFSLEKSLEILHQNAVNGNLDENVVEEFSRFVGKTDGRQLYFSPREAQIQSIATGRSTVHARRRTTR